MLDTIYMKQLHSPRYIPSDLPIDERRYFPCKRDLPFFGGALEVLYLAELANVDSELLRCSEYSSSGSCWMTELGLDLIESGHRVSDMSGIVDRQFTISR